jgi:hypothetical protein
MQSTIQKPKSKSQAKPKAKATSTQTKITTTTTNTTTNANTSVHKQLVDLVTVVRFYAFPFPFLRAAVLLFVTVFCLLCFAAT